jgi:hypothetical protein
VTEPGSNRYAPPKAAVDDVTSGAQPERPPQVTRAVRLLWLTLALSFAGSIVSMVFAPASEMPQSLLIGWLAVGWLVGLLIAWWLLSSLGKGKNWARIVQLVFFVFSVLSSTVMFATPEAAAAVTPLAWLLYAIQMALNLWGIILLFSSVANSWFRAMKDWA